MPVDLVQGSQEWDNYHRTGKSQLLGRYALRSAGLGSGREDLAEGALQVRAWLLNAQRDGVPVRPVGGAWSPSNIQTVDGGWMLNTRRFNRIFRIAPGDLGRGASIDAGALALVEGGVQIDEINDKLEGVLQRSLRSTGASNGQTLAGACATGTHGSVIGAGGIQDHVRAVQIVVPGGIYWIEPAAGLMSDAFIAATGSTPLRDDEAFAAALIAVGSLGIVTAMVIETVPLFLVRPVLKLIDFSQTDLALLAQGDFQGFAARHDPGAAEPYFVMVITNPHAPFTRKAVLRLLYREPVDSALPRAESPNQLGAGYDSFTMLGFVLRNFPWARGRILELLMKAGVGNGIGGGVAGTWGETTETHKPMADLFTAAIFCDRNDLPRVYPTACGAFDRAGGSTVLTLRFLNQGPGLLSPARWAATAGLDCDGPNLPKTKGAFVSMMTALDREQIGFTRHWGKFNDLSETRVIHDYGPDLVRWKAVRDRLMPDLADRALFRCADLDRLGLTT